MKKANQPIHFPNEFREMVACKEINVAVLMQVYVNLVNVFAFFSQQKYQGLSEQVHNIQGGMIDYQISDKNEADQILWGLNAKYLNILMDLSMNENLSVKQKNRRSDIVIKDWEIEVAPLLDYPREVTLENGGKVTISFNYFLACLCCKISIRKDLKNFMRLSYKQNEKI